MKEGPNISNIAALIGDPARANMLSALMSGKALTVSELAAEAGVTAQTASGHLSKLLDGELVHVRSEGRHKYFTLSGEDVAKTLENLMGLAARFGHLRTRTGPKDLHMRKARVCYNHLAGHMGVELYESLLKREMIYLDAKDVRLSPAGESFVRDFGVDIDKLKTLKRRLCRECLDWSERRSHLAGSLGQALLDQIVVLGWAHRKTGSRVVTFTAQGEAQFRDVLIK